MSLLLYIHCHWNFQSFPKKVHLLIVVIFCLQKKEKIAPSLYSVIIAVSVWQMLLHCSIWYSVFSLDINYISNFFCMVTMNKFYFHWKSLRLCTLFLTPERPSYFLKLYSTLLVLNLILNIYFLIHW